MRPTAATGTLGESPTTMEPPPQSTMDAAMSTLLLYLSAMNPTGRLNQP